MAAFMNTSTPVSLPLRRHCPDCDEEYLADGDCCLVCGATIVMIPIPQTHSTNNTSFIDPNLDGGDNGGDSENNLTAYLDLFGIDFQDLLQRFNSSSNNQVLSQDYASTLGKIDVDDRFTILFNYVIRIGPLKINSVPANFSPLSVEDVIEAPLVIATPDLKLVNAEDIQGSIVLMDRGVISFAQKCKLAESFGAVGIIVAQTNSKWPFVMADSAAELGDAIARIPICMVSQTDGELLFKWVRSKQAAVSSSSSPASASASSSSSLSSATLPSGKSNTSIILKGEMLSRECSVCQDNMESNENVLRLSCCHSFHTDCIMTWLNKNNNCPMCRHVMPSVTVKSTAGRGRDASEGGDETSNHRQNYFA